MSDALRLGRKLLTSAQVFRNHQADCFHESREKFGGILNFLLRLIRAGNRSQPACEILAPGLKFIRPIRCPAASDLSDAPPDSSEKRPFAAKLLTCCLPSFYLDYNNKLASRESVTRAVRNPNISTRPRTATFCLPCNRYTASEPNSPFCPIIVACRTALNVTASFAETF